ncbi:hypothetical protein OJ252_1336 [Cryptosporidium canis]|uniref:ABC transporter family protein n=1 Tax=Cryptosporidium canis TaxID=195482 RepID=A0ABQ8P982_9CRYT|nr:hypothetical protein OJ252_1336 [Cryptosporidium canis]
MKSRVRRLLEFTWFSWVNQSTKGWSGYGPISDTDGPVLEGGQAKGPPGRVSPVEERLEAHKYLLSSSAYLGDRGDFRLGKRLLETFWAEFLACILLKTAMIGLAVCLNVSLKSFIKVVYSSNQLAPGLVLLVLQICKIVLDCHTSFFIANMSLKLQVFITRAAHEGLVGDRLNPEPSREGSGMQSGSPNIYNVIFGDLSSLETFIQAVLELLTVPLKILGAWMLLQSHIGISANPSVLVYTLLYLASLGLQALGALYKARFMGLRDERIRKCHEYFSSLPAIRQLFWEDLVYEDLMSVRRLEVVANLTRFLFLMLGTFVEYNAHTVAKYVLFFSFVFNSANRVADSDSYGATIASSVSALHALGILMSPTKNIVSSIVEGVISVRRVLDYFDRHERARRADRAPTEGLAVLRDRERGRDLRPPSQRDSELLSPDFLCPDSHSESDSCCLIGMKGPFDSRMELNLSSLRIKRNELCILSGKSGSGKSSLIDHILHRLDAAGDKGLQTLHVSQEIWFPKGTVRSAILFGREYDPQIYERVVQACCLSSEFGLWKERDLRQLDESDQTLSCGQKSRINLARALYYLLLIQKTQTQDTPDVLIVLDDVFSTLDTPTSAEIFENLFRQGSGLIAGESCIVTIYSDRISALTSRTELPRDQSVRVIILDKGAISYSGSLRDYLGEFPSSQESRLQDSVRQSHQSVGHAESESESEPDCRDPSGLEDDTVHVGQIPPRTTGLSLDSKYLYYLRYIGVSYSVAFSLVCILKIGVSKFMDIYITSFQSAASKRAFIVKYSILLLLKLLLDLTAYISEALLSAKSSSSIHKNYLASLLRAPLSFYSLTPISRILSRFNLDLLVLDDILVRKIVGVVIRILEPLVHLTLVFCMSPILFPLSIIHIILITVLYGFPLFRIYRTTQMAILSINSSLNNNFSEMIHGRRVIRSFNNGPMYREELCRSLLSMIRARIVQISAIQWASIRIQLLSGPLVVLLYLAHVLYCSLSGLESPERPSLGGVEAGYVIYFYITFTETLNLIFVKASSLEKDMCSLERIMDYSDKSLGKKTGTEDLLQEEAVSDRQLVDNGDARLRFVDVELSYRVSDFTGKDDAVTFKAVKGFNLELSPNEHIGIIGRTGCGKSTLIKGILGVIRPASGKILYNDVEISTLSTKKRREMIGVVPQTPLKVGDWSIRRYLDPFNEHTKESILGALKLTGLYYVIEEQTRTADIDSVRISDSNCDNCLSLTDIHLKYLNFVRLVLNKEKYRVILLDEPTIEQTEPEDGTNTPPTHQPRLVPIEDLLREHFPHCSVVIVSHNVHILKYCNRIINSRKSRNKLGDSRQDCLDSNRNGVPGCITRLTQEGGIFERNLEWPRMSIELKRASSRNEGDLESNTNETKESASFINSLKSGSLKSSSLNSAMITSSSEPSHANARVVEVPLKESAMWIQMLIGFVTVVKATVGTGILFAPYAIVKSGYGVSIALILVYWLLNVVCTILMFQCADEANDTYSGIAAVALGRPGRILADVSITFTQLSFCAVFATFVTKAIQNVISGIHNCAPGYVEYGTALITFIQLVVYVPMSCFGRIQSLGPAMIMANIALLIGLITVFTYSALELASDISNNTVARISQFTNLESIAGFVGTAAFLWVSGPVVISYYVSIADYNTRKNFYWVYTTAISFVFALTTSFTFVAAFGYGENTFSAVTLNLPTTPGAVFGQISFAISILLSFPLMLFPVKEIVTRCIDIYWKKHNKNKILEFIVPAEQARQLSIQRTSSKLNTPIVSQRNSPGKESFSPNSNHSKLGSKSLLRQPSGSISFTLDKSSQKVPYYLVKSAPSAIAILLSVICCMVGFFLIDSLGNFVNLVGGIFCVPISIILPAIFHLTMFKKRITLPMLVLDILLIISGVITSITVIWYTIVSWSSSSESICNLQR